jgi:hypothetical protein
VVVTGYGTQEAEESAKAIGVSEFLQKPLTPSIIEEVAARIMGRKAEAVAAEAAAATAAARPESVARNVALFFAAPFIGLAYIIAAPFVGFYMIARLGVRRALGNK